MNKFFLVAIMLIATAGSCDAVAKPKDWSEKERQLWHTYIALSVVDTAQTWRMIECQQARPSCPLVERNPILGSHPSKSDLITLKLLGNVIIYAMLDGSIPEERVKALKWMNAAQGLVVAHNGIYYMKRF